MSQSTIRTGDPAAQSPKFHTTHWSVVLAAAEGGSPEAQAALERLCRTYWFPLYAYVPRQGHSEHDAQDVTQSFFARFLEKEYVRLADRARGRFRSFLLTSLKHFLVNEWERGQAARRGSGQAIISWDESEAEQRYHAEQDIGLTAEKVFDRRWAAAVLESALTRLRAEYAAAGKEALFDRFKSFVWGGDGLRSYPELATQTGMTESAIRVAVHRMRQRYREVLRAEVSHTVATASEVDEELRYLLEVIRH